MSTKVKNSFGSNLTTNRPAAWPVGEQVSRIGNGQQLTPAARQLHGGAIRSETITNKDLVFKFYSNTAKGRAGAGRVMMNYGGRYVA